MQEHWTIVDNNFWYRKWFFFRKFDRVHASSIAYKLMQCAFAEAGVPITVEEEAKILDAFIDFIRQNSDRKWGTKFLYFLYRGGNKEQPCLCIGMQPAKDPRRFALKISRCPFLVKPKTAEVEWTYDFRPGSKIQGRQIDDHEI